jgi:hypothetical protein
MVLDIVICAFELYMLFDLGKGLLQINGYNIAKRLAMNTPLYLLFLSVNSANSSLLNLAVIPLIYLMFSAVNFVGSFLKKSCLAVCYYMLAILPEFIFALIANVNSEFAYRLLHNNEVLMFMTLLLMKMVTFILVKCVAQIHKRKFYEEDQDKVFLSLMVLPLATIVLLSGMFYADVHVISPTAKYIVLTGAILLLIANAFTFYLFDKMLINMQRAQKMERLYLKSQLEKRHLDQLKKADEERKRLLHDINKYIRAAASCFSAKNIEEAKIIFDKLNIKIQSTNVMEYSTSHILNAILTERIRAAEEIGVKISVRIEPEVDFDFLDEIDMIAILGNLLDNAYEAAAPLYAGGVIDVRVFTENNGHFLIVNIDNNFKTEPVHKSGRYLTRKMDKGNHGIGIHTVEQIVKRYKGRMIIKVEGNTFKVTIIFQR